MHRSELLNEAGYASLRKTQQQHHSSYAGSGAGAAPWGQLRTMGFDFANGPSAPLAQPQQQQGQGAAGRSSALPPDFDEIPYDTSSTRQSEPYQILRLPSSTAATASTQRAWAQAVGGGGNTDAALGRGPLQPPHAATTVAGVPGAPVGQEIEPADVASPVAGAAASTTTSSGMPAIGSKRRPAAAAVDELSTSSQNPPSSAFVIGSSLKPKTPTPMEPARPEAWQAQPQHQGMAGHANEASSVAPSLRHQPSRGTPPPVQATHTSVHGAPTGFASHRPSSSPETSSHYDDARVVVPPVVDDNEPVVYSRSATQMSWASQPPSDANGDGDTDIVDATDDWNAQPQPTLGAAAASTDRSHRHEHTHPLASTRTVDTSSSPTSHRSVPAAVSHHGTSMGTTPMAAVPPLQSSPIQPVDHALSPFEYELRGGSGNHDISSPASAKKRTQKSAALPLSQIDHRRDTHRAEHLRAALHEATRRIAMLNQTLVQLAEGHALLHDQDVALRSEVAAAEAERASTQHNCATLKADLEEGIELLSSQLHAKRQRLEHLRRENERLRQAIGDNETQPHITAQPGAGVQ